MDDARDRIARVFRFLEALHQHRSPVVTRIADQPWLLWLHRLPDHPAIRVGRYEDVDAEAAPERAGEGDGGGPVGSTTLTGGRGEDTDFVLKVRRPALADPPPPPEILRDWLDDGWDDPFCEPEVIGTVAWDEDDGSTTEEQFEDVPARMQAFRSWKRQRKAWAQKEAPARKAYWVYEQLYELHGILERESERVELVIGDGVLKWRADQGAAEAGQTAGRIEHPVLLDKVQLLFDPGAPEFTVAEVGAETELYTGLLRSLPGVGGPAISRFQEDLEGGLYHPLGKEATSDFLRRVAATLSRHGALAGDGRRSGSREKTGEPEIARAPVLFLRRREHGFAAAIESVRRDVRDREDIPASLFAIVGAQEPPPDEEEDDLPSWHEPRDILLSKPANPEQIRIARALGEKGAVLVQGPPGTGKSHTIANLIGHLLAEGESVLVTAHTTKALRVLRQHIVEPLRPLCVSVLERDAESRGQLEAAVEAIAEKMSTSSVGQLEESAAALDRERQGILDRLERRRDDLCRAVGSEYVSIEVDGKEHSPTEAARIVAETGESDGWIPGVIQKGSRLPVSALEAGELYATNERMSPEDESELSGELPVSEKLPSPREYGELVRRKESLEGEERSEGESYWSEAASAGTRGHARPPDRAGAACQEAAQMLEGLKELLADALTDLSADSPWRLSIVEAGYKGGVHREPWDRLVEQIREYCRESARSKNLLLEHDPRVKRTSLPMEDLLGIAEEVVAQMEAGRELGWLTRLLHPSWRYLIGRTRVSDRRPHDKEHFKAIGALVRNKMLLERLKGRWDRQVASLGGPGSEDFVDPEDAFAIFADQMDALLSWPQKLGRLTDGLKALGFDWDAYKEDRQRGHTRVIAASQYADLVRLRDMLLAPLTAILDSRLVALRHGEIEGRLDGLRDRLARTEAAHGAAVTRDLAGASSAGDVEAYGRACGRLKELEGLRSVFERREELLARLERVAPDWARAIRQRTDVHGRAAPPGDVARAWTWRRLASEVESRGETPVEEIQAEIEDLGRRLRRVTVGLIDARAWAHQIRRTREHPRQRQALVGWLDTVRRIGAGTGKRVPLLNRHLREQMADCREAVPVWIMPLSRLPDNFDFRRTRFDVAIVDEASQSDVMALLALWIAKKVVIVGDHEQVSPVAVGQRVEAVQRLIDEHLQGVPNSHLYDGRMSVYDLARQSFGDTICLLEHFRCAPDIIGFSNMLSYDGRIRPLRDPQGIALRPSVIAHRVADGVARNKVNEREARAVAALVAAATEQPEYEGRTMGALSLVGEEQALLVERLVREHLEPGETEGRRMISGIPAQFQGDERDVMFLSMVDGPPDGKPLSRRAEDMYRQRFNVAASRARDQMWVVHSLDAARDLKPGDLRRTLIEYAEAVARGEGPAQGAAGGGDGVSRLEDDVIKRLAAAGYMTRSQLGVGYYRVDVVVHDLQGRRLAVECDGDRYLAPEKVRGRLARQATLERLGWQFARVRGSQFYRDPEEAMAPVFARIKELGLEPDLGSAGTGDASVAAGEGRTPAGGADEAAGLVGRVLERARRLEIEWTASGRPRARA